MATVASIITAGLYDLRDPSGTNYNKDGAYAELLIYLNRALFSLDLYLASQKSDWTLNEGISYLSEGLSSISFPTSAFGIRELWSGKNQIHMKDAQYLYYQRKFNITELFDSVVCKWTVRPSAAGTYYVNLLSDGTTPGLTASPSYVVMDGVKLTKTAVWAAIADHEWDYGDHDTLGYSTVYIADASGDPDTTGAVIQIITAGTGLPTCFTEKGETCLFDFVPNQNYPLRIYYDKHATALTSGGNMPYGDQFNEALREMMVLLAKNRDDKNAITSAYMYDFFAERCGAAMIMKQFSPKQYRLDF